MLPGYPFKWDVYADNTAEVNTLEHNIKACQNMGYMKHSYYSV